MKTSLSSLTGKHLHLAVLTPFCLILGCDQPASSSRPNSGKTEPPKESIELPSDPAELAAAADRGRAHFDTYACWRCHTLGDEEFPGQPDFDNLGPDLATVGDRLDPILILESITDPNRQIAPPESDHVNEQGFSKMPPFDSVIPETEMQDLVVFLSQLKSPPTKLNKPVVVTEANFEATIAASSQLILLDFWAEWCLPCLELEPILETLAAELGDQIKICKINVDDNPDLVAEYVPDNIFPCLVLMRDKALLERIYGTDPKMEPKPFLEQWIGNHLADTE